MDIEGCVIDDTPLQTGSSESRDLVHSSSDESFASSNASPEVNRDANYSESSLMESSLILQHAVQDTSIEKPADSSYDASVVMQDNTTVGINLEPMAHAPTDGTAPLFDVVVPRLRVVFRATRVGFVSRRRWIYLVNTSNQDQEVYVKEMIGPFRIEDDIMKAIALKDQGLKFSMVFEPLEAGPRSGRIVFGVTNAPHINISYYLKGKGI